MSWRQEALRRSEKAMHCRTIMRKGKLLARMPKLEPPPREMTKAERHVATSRERVKR